MRDSSQPSISLVRYRLIPLSFLKLANAGVPVLERRLTFRRQGIAALKGPTRLQVAVLHQPPQPVTEIFREQVLSHEQRHIEQQRPEVPPGLQIITATHHQDVPAMLFRDWILYARHSSTRLPPVHSLTGSPRPRRCSGSPCPIVLGKSYSCVGKPQEREGIELEV